MQLTNYQASKVIEDAEKRITSHMTKIQELKPQVEDYKAAYEKLRDELHVIECELIEDKNLLEFASKEKNGVQGPIKRVVRSESHNDMKPREQRKLSKQNHRIFTWTEWAVAILRNKDARMTTEQLWKAVDFKFRVTQLAKEHDKYLPKIKSGAIKGCWQKAADMTWDGNYFGLKEWAGAREVYHG